MTLYDRLVARARTSHGSPFLVGEDRLWTAGELLEASNTVADRLAAARLDSGDRVVVRIPNAPEFLAVWFALCRQRLVLVPVSPEAPASDVDRIVRHSSARLIICTKDSGRSSPSRLGVPEWLLSEDAPPVAEPGLDDDSASLPEGAASVLYTSGSTGKPKGCILTHRYYSVAGRTFVENMELEESDRLLLMLPLFHMNAQVTTVAGALLSGATIAWTGRFSLSRFWRQVELLQPTQAFFIGAIPVLLMRQAEGPTRSSLRKVACAGVADPIHLECERRFGLTMVESYGSTEAGIVTMEGLREPHEPGSVGRPVAGKMVEIRRSDGTRCSVGEEGDIWIRGEGLMSGYLGDQKSTAAVLRDGWLRAPDVGFFDEGKRLHFTARRDDVVRRSGENVSLREVENVLRSHAAVSEVAVLALPDPIYDVELEAYVVLSGESSALGAELVQLCLAELARHKVPRRLHLCRDLPRTGMERVSKARLKEEGAIGHYASFDLRSELARRKRAIDLCGDE